MADFLTAFKLTTINEGGYSNHPNDRGGETYKGISRRAWPTWGGWQIIDGLKQKDGFPGNLEESTALQTMVPEFYKKNFWLSLSLDAANDQYIANELFDTGVNMGTGVAGLFLQRVLNVANKNGVYYPDLKLDGAVGRKTISALNRHPNPEVILKGLNCLQGAKYIDIAEANHSQEAFVNGWLLNRISSL